MIEHAQPLDDDPAPRVGDGLVKLALVLRQRAWHDANEVGLSATQVQILVFLHRHATLPNKLGTVARDLNLTNATVSDAVRTLEAKGHLRKERDPRDPRALALSLTDSGRHTAERSANPPNFLLAAVDVLSPDEQTVFLRGLTKMIRQLQERGDIPVAGLCVTCAHFRPNVHLDAERPHHCAFVNAPFGDYSLRLDCAEHESAPPEQRNAAWQRWRDSSQ